MEKREGDPNVTVEAKYLMWSLVSAEAWGA